MQIFSKILESLNPFAYKQKAYTSGPNTLSELLNQFDLPPKEKTQEDVVRDYLVKETMAGLEIEMLKMEKTNYYKGQQMWEDTKGKFYDWVYCSVRPEVLYCCYGKN